MLGNKVGDTCEIEWWNIELGVGDTGFCIVGGVGFFYFYEEDFEKDLEFFYFFKNIRKVICLLGKIDFVGYIVERGYGVCRIIVFRFRFG